MSEPTRFRLELFFLFCLFFCLFSFFWGGGGGGGGCAYILLHLCYVFTLGKMLVSRSQTLDGKVTV